MVRQPVSLSPSLLALFLCSRFTFPDISFNLVPCQRKIGFKPAFIWVVILLLLPLLLLLLCVEQVTGERHASQRPDPLSSLMLRQIKHKTSESLFCCPTNISNDPLIFPPSPPSDSASQFPGLCVRQDSAQCFLLFACELMQLF